SASAANFAVRKPGYFASENDLIKRIREATGTGRARNPIAFLVEAADDTVYSVGDIEDGVKKGILAWRDVQDTLTTSGDLNAKAALAGMERILKAGRASLPKGLADDVFASAFRTASIGI